MLQELTNSTGYSFASQSNALSNDKATSETPINLSIILELIRRQSSRVMANMLRRSGTRKSALGQTELMRSSSVAHMQWSGNVTLEPEPTIDTNSAHLASSTRIFTVSFRGLAKGNQPHILKQYAAGSFAKLQLKLKGMQVMCDVKCCDGAVFGVLRCCYRCIGSNCCMSPTNTKVVPPNGRSISWMSLNIRSTASMAHL
jgi:hypothetical protein